MLVIDDNRAVWQKADLKSVVGFSTRLEGRKAFGQGGSFRFEPTGSNIELFRQRFPDVPIEDNRQDLSAFVDVEIAAERPLFQFKRPPMDHQRKAFDKLKENRVFGLIYSPGCGKSSSLTALTTYHWTKGEIDALIVVTPNALVSKQWHELQLARDTQDDLPYRAWLWGKTKAHDSDYKELMQFDGLRIIILNIDAVKTPSGEKLVTDFVKQHKGRVLCALDESHLCKNKSSQRWKAMERVMKACSHRAILTGTPIAKDLIDFWSQMALLDERIIGVKYKTAFMSRYCITKFNGFANEVIGHQNVDEFYAKIDPYVYRVSQEELGLQKFEDEFVFEMHPEQKALYKQVKETFIASLDNGEFKTSANAISAMATMQAISNGFLPRGDGTFQELPNARLEALQAFLETLPEDEKVVIWCRFLKDAELILHGLGKKALDLSGNVTKEQRIANKDRFIADRKILYVVGTPDAAGTGVDGLQDVTNRAVRYSLSYNMILHQQAEDRTSRVGGSGVAFYTDLVCKGSLDRKILNNLRGKKDLSKLALDDIRLMMMDA